MIVSAKERDLSAVPYDGGPAVSQLALALARVVMAQQEVILQDQDGKYELHQKPPTAFLTLLFPTYIQGSKAVPAEDVFATFAHHLKSHQIKVDRSLQPIT